MMTARKTVLIWEFKPPVTMSMETENPCLCIGMTIQSAVGSPKKGEVFFFFDAWGHMIGDRPRASMICRMIHHIGRNAEPGETPGTGLISVKFTPENGETFSDAAVLIARDLFGEFFDLGRGENAPPEKFELKQIPWVRVKEGGEYRWMEQGTFLAKKHGLGMWEKK